MTHMGTSGVTKPQEQRLMEATDPTLATDPAALMRNSAHTSAPLHSSWRQQSMQSFLPILSEDYVQLNLKEKYSKIECNMV